MPTHKTVWNPRVNSGEYQNMCNSIKDKMLPHLMRQYAAQSTVQIEEMVNRVVKELDGRKFAVWGAGSFSQHLIPMLPKEKIVCIVDRDGGKQGSEICGITVCVPPPVTDKPILVAAVFNARSILNDIKNRGMKNQIITVGERHD